MTTPKGACLEPEVTGGRCWRAGPGGEHGAERGGERRGGVGPSVGGGAEGDPGPAGAAGQDQQADERLPAEGLPHAGRLLRGVRDHFAAGQAEEALLRCLPRTELRCGQGQPSPERSGRSVPGARAPASRQLRGQLGVSRVPLRSADTSTRPPPRTLRRSGLGTPGLRPCASAPGAGRGSPQPTTRQRPDSGRGGHPAEDGLGQPRAPAQHFHRDEHPALFAHPFLHRIPQEPQGTAAVSSRP